MEDVTPPLSDDDEEGRGGQPVADVKRERTPPLGKEEEEEEEKEDELALRKRLEMEDLEDARKAREQKPRTLPAWMSGSPRRKPEVEEKKATPKKKAPTKPKKLSKKDSFGVEGDWIGSGSDSDEGESLKRKPAKGKKPRKKVRVQGTLL